MSPREFIRKNLRKMKHKELINALVEKFYEKNMDSSSRDEFIRIARNWIRTVKNNE
jgi:hypothetical protein